jgi:hypothetical protein
LIAINIYQNCPSFNIDGLVYNIGSVVNLPCPAWAEKDTQAMPRQNKSSQPENKPQEQIELSFLGFRFKCSSSTFKTVIILSIILIFLLVLVHWLPKITVVKWLTG